VFVGTIIGNVTQLRYQKHPKKSFYGQKIILNPQTTTIYCYQDHRH